MMRAFDRVIEESCRVRSVHLPLCAKIYPSSRPRCIARCISKYWIFPDVVPRGLIIPCSLRHVVQLLPRPARPAMDKVHYPADYHFWSLVAADTSASRIALVEQFIHFMT